MLGSSAKADDDDDDDELDEVAPGALINSGATLFLFSGGGLDTVFSAEEDDTTGFLEFKGVRKE